MLGLDGLRHLMLPDAHLQHVETATESLDLMLRQEKNDSIIMDACERK